VVRGGAPRVDFLPAGRGRLSPHKLLGNGNARQWLGQVVEHYRYVVIDTPPILAAGESLVLAKLAAATLLCAMRDVSRAGQVQKACERLVAAGCRTVGAVLNGVPVAHYQYRYGSHEPVS